MPPQRCFCGTCKACKHRPLNRAWRQRKDLREGITRRRYPIEPLLRVAPLSRLAAATNGQIYRLARQGDLSEMMADRVAGALGYHPSEIWSEWFDELEDAV